MIWLAHTITPPRSASHLLFTFTGITDNVTGSLSQSFIYSAANRLTAATGPYGNYSWSYDLVGNRTSEGVAPPGGMLS